MIMRDPQHHLASKRSARAMRSVMAGVAFQATYVLVQFIILAVLIREVGEERFGMWVTIFSMTMWVSVLLLEAACVSPRVHVRRGSHSGV